MAYDTPYTPKNNTGSLFKNEKQTEAHPDYKGQAMIGGVEMWMSAWIKESIKGTKFMSFNFQPKDQQSAPKKAAAPAAPDFDDDMPF
jgi:hypothetical protein